MAYQVILFCIRGEPECMANETTSDAYMYEPEIPGGPKGSIWPQHRSLYRCLRKVVRRLVSRGSTMHMGRTVVLDTGKVEIIVISQHVEPYDLGCFYSLGIDPLAKTFLMLKSRIHYRATYMPIAKKIVECAGCGVCTSDYNQISFEKVRRPIYPLDNINSWDLSQSVYER